MKFDFMPIYEGFFLKMVHLFHLFQFVKSELEQDSANRAKTQVNTEKFCSNFFGINWNKLEQAPQFLAYVLFPRRCVRGAGRRLFEPISAHK